LWPKSSYCPFSDLSCFSFFPPIQVTGRS
jgi:hypothetical protein